jgi:hypothetical protein
MLHCRVWGRETPDATRALLEQCSTPQLALLSLNLLVKHRGKAMPCVEP